MLQNHAWRTRRLNDMNDIRALLLTDVVDSTKLTEDIGDTAVAAVWRAHDRAARDLLLPWRGLEIDKTDGMLLMFESIDDAAGYALAYHAALARLPTPLKARAGIHLGPVVLRQNSAEDIARGAKPIELDGMAKPTCARVMSLALGGQVLLTPEARAAMNDVALEGRRLESCGHWVLKGVTEPLELFDLAAADLPLPVMADSEKAHRVVRSGERWLPVREIPNNLPQPATSFIGRERELSELKARLGKARLITLLGMGGLGKTRLSLQVAEEVKHQFPDGVWFIDLSPISDPALVADEAAQALGVRQEAERPLLQTLCAHLKLRRVLLVVDNCEHLIEPAGDLVDALMRAAPGVRVLASSRSPLDVPGEQSFMIQPLPLPGRGDDLQTLSRSTAVRLFVERGQAHRPDFALDAQDPAAVALLVSRLEGIPLAIELAAARLRTLEVDEINAGLQQRYEMLSGGSRRLQPRQQTLRGLVDWSYDLLSANEKATLGRLSVFVGSFDAPAAAAVCGSAPLAPGKVTGLLASLVEKSLVMRETHGRGTRYRMLETLRDYAREKLDEAGDAEPTAVRHCEHFFALVKEARKGLLGADQALWLGRIEADHDNVRSATALALAGGVDPFVAVKIAVALQGFWILRGYVSEGRAVVKAALAMPAVQASDMAHGFALYVGAALADSQSDRAQAIQMLQTCLELRRRAGDPTGIAESLSTLALARLNAGDIAGAIENEREALALFRAEGHRVGELIGLQHLGMCAMALGDDVQARDEFEQSLVIAKDEAYREVEAECELLLGEIDLELGHFAHASEHFELSLATARGAADKRGEANALRWQGKLRLAAGDPAASASLLAEALLAFEAFEMREELLGCLEDHAQLTLAMRELPKAVKLTAAVEHWRKRMSLVRSPRTMQRWQRWQQALRSAAEPAIFEASWNAGTAWDLAEAVRQARSLPQTTVSA